ncbi:MAG: hypothetical protein MUQ10_17080 [Anaerolineae bacterium]|nr:hypothetical protein [Anaerolineae bacterium]
MLRCFRYLDGILPDLWMTDTRRAESPYQTITCHDSNLPPDIKPEDLPSYHHVFEFQLAPSSRREGRHEAVEIERVSRFPGRI